MYAEATIELGQIDATVTDAINQVRRRAGMPDVPAGLSQDSMRVLVRHERRVELALEGLRLFDIRRWRLAAQVMPGHVYGIEYFDQPKGAAPGTGTPQTWVGLAGDRVFNQNRDYVWPIPQRERDLNPQLVQNPGY